MIEETYKTLFISKAEKIKKYIHRYNYNYTYFYKDKYYIFILKFENEKRFKTFNNYFYKDAIIEKR